MYGVLYLIRTLGETRRAATAADKAAEAAMTANVAFGQAMLRQDRAYLTIVHAKLTQDTDGTPLVELAFKNVGRTPAKDVEIFYSSDAQSSSYSGDPTFGPAKYDGDRAGEDTWRVSFRISAEQRQAIAAAFVADSDLVFWVIGEARYRDVFGEERTTKFRFCRRINTGWSPGEFELKDMRIQ
ncbi:MAG: hypothetical protein B7Z20_01660 [Sphingobium sp. 32-64-5]|nr:MAG: hypothetical protein B7Z20_01660 [Sphingobium sp. 32-64-5]